MTNDPQADAHSLPIEAELAPDSEKSFKDLRRRAIRMLSVRDYSRAELLRKLLRPARTRQSTPGGIRAGAADPIPEFTRASSDPLSPVDPLMVERVLDDLTARAYLSDSRVAASLARRARDRYGSSRLAQMLASHGIDRELSAVIIADEKSGEFERAKTVWQRRFNAAPADLKERGRQARYLSYRGFSADIIARVLRASEGQSDPDF